MEVPYISPDPASWEMNALQLQAFLDNIAKGPPGGTVSKSASQVVNNETETAVTWDTEEADPDGYFDVASPTRFTIPPDFDGKYDLLATASFDAYSGGARYLYWKQNGTGDPLPSTLLVPGTPTGLQTITATQLTSGTSDVDGTGFTTGVITPSANKLVLLAVNAARTDATDRAAPTISGNGLTWVRVAEHPWGETVFRRLVLYRAMGASPSTGAVTITWPGTVESCQWSIAEFGGVSTSGANGENAIVQSAVDDGDGYISIVLNVFENAGKNAAYGTFAVNGAGSWTPGSGFSELSDVANALAPLQTISSEWKLGQDITVDATPSASGNNAGIVVELRAGPSTTNNETKLVAPVTAVDLVGDDYVEVYAWHDAGTPLNLQGGDSIRATIMRRRDPRKED